MRQGPRAVRVSVSFSAEFGIGSQNEALRLRVWTLRQPSVRQLNSQMPAPARTGTHDP